jgi:hypothetical protein
MGIYDPCKNNSVIYPIIYISVIIVLIIIGSLYEADILPKTQEYTKKSVWWYGFIGIIIIGILLPIINKLIKYIHPLESTFWYISHVLCYFIITFVSPGQWPFWLAIGIMWELFECYGSCKLVKKGFPISCSGLYDITANIAGIAIAMWIRSESK